jgi:enterochelin esterase family protein
MFELAHRQGTPLFEGNAAVFLWEGERPPSLVGDFNNWRLERAPEWAALEPGAWVTWVSLPADAYAEYGFHVDGRHVADPLNPASKPNPYGSRNSYLYMPGATPTPLVRRARGVPKGTLTRHPVEGSIFTAEQKRTIELYQPPSEEPSPLLVVFDGPDYLRQARIIPIIENLLAQGRMSPVALALVPHGGDARYNEYNCSDSTVALVQRVVLPLAREHLRLVDVCAEPGAYGVMGASMGGLMALYTALRVPEIFGRVLSQSGTFGLAMGTYESVVLDLVRYLPRRPLSVWMDCGVFELLLDANRELHRLLVARGYDVKYREYSGGHNYHAWREDVWRGLEALFSSAGEGRRGEHLEHAANA